MTSQNDHYFGLIKLILPEELFDYFELINFEIRDNQVHVYLEEVDVKPAGYEKEKLISKSFHAPVTIQDFLLRDKPMFLHIRRRRWLVESSNQVISRNWNTVAKGKRGVLAGMIKGTKSEEVVAVLKKIPEKLRRKVEEITRDMA